MTRSICVLTGSRAEYGLLKPLMEAIRDRRGLELRTLVTGMHLAPEFGLTWKRIVEDGFAIDRKVDMLLASDEPVAISKGMGLGQIGFAQALEDLRPEALVLLGDRFEILPAAAAAAIARIPVAHIHGGELSEGAVDELFRHAVTKLSHLHFTATEEYRARVIRMGESPDRVFNVGALGLDAIAALRPTPRSTLERDLGFTLGPRTAVVTFHPATLDEEGSGSQFQALLDALDGLEGIRFIFTKANADAGGRAVNALAEAYCVERPDKAVLFASLGQQRYLSLLALADVVIGNSSSGIIEAPSFKIPTVNIGDRQKGRIRAASVIDCQPGKASIRAAVDRALDPAFRAGLASLVNPFGDGHAAPRIVEQLASADLRGLLRKTFHDTL